MSGLNKQKNNLALIIGGILITVGLWVLAERVFAPWWPSISQMLKIIANIMWPLAIIASGVFVIIGARKGIFSSPNGRKLYRSHTNKKIAGVCGGLADYLSLDAAIVRIVAILLLLFSFLSVGLVYLFLWLCIPEEPQ